MAAAQRVGGSGSLYFRASPGQCPRLRCRPEHSPVSVCVAGGVGGGGRVSQMPDHWTSGRSQAESGQGPRAQNC